MFPKILLLVIVFCYKCYSSIPEAKVFSRNILLSIIRYYIPSLNKLLSLDLTCLF